MKIQGSSGTDQKIETDDYGNFHFRLLEIIFRAADRFSKKTSIMEWKRKAHPESIVITDDILTCYFQIYE